jgi:hypothetical protein
MRDSRAEQEFLMKKIIAAIVVTGLLSAGLANAADMQPQSSNQNSAQTTPAVAGASAASTASTGGVTAATVVGVGIAVAAVALIVAGGGRNSHAGGTTGTH